MEIPVCIDDPEPPLLASPISLLRPAMPRLLRVILPGVPLHITQRGVDRCPTFLDSDDYALYRWALRESANEHGCAVHAYVLMTNHVHLLTTPSDLTGPACMMRSLGKRYVRYFNDRYRRTGTLWEGRYRSTVVDSLPYLFTCSRYIELNPVRAGMVPDPHAYEWSSYRRNAAGLDDGVISEHPKYTSLGSTPVVRCSAYRAMFATELTPAALAAVRSAHRGRSKRYSTTYHEAVEALYKRMTSHDHDALERTGAGWSAHSQDASTSERVEVSAAS